MKTKRIIILEGADSCGKSSLSAHLQKMANGKCHVLHSNYNKELPQQNHFRQHYLMAKFALDSFNAENYTGNYTVIFDRNYISDITYGQIGYGSKGTLTEKYKNLEEMFSFLSSDKSIKIYLIYCKPNRANFNKESKEELLTDNENTKMQRIYDSVMFSHKLKSIIDKYGIELYIYNYNEDPEYEILDIYLNMFK